jgi:hypothetical protein
MLYVYRASNVNPIFESNHKLFMGVKLSVSLPPPLYAQKLFYIFPIYRSGDSTARIWTIADSAQNAPSNVVVLKHFKGRTNEKSKDVTTLDWNVSVCVMIIVGLLPSYYSSLNLR